MVPPTPTSFAVRSDLATLVTQDPSGVIILHFATPEGIVEFVRMMMMVESRYYCKLSPRILCTTRPSRH